ncbi:hypothetical protein AWC01_07270 [Mycobacterium doricum]|uniref:Uncharacterized protein n=1 Tax=Mycolicibacterium doricum TaxID=126673 RepID=A0A1X1TEJ4_9MYCO|nr:hypothetical protein AWC01_07270 [Mycolicibacterium doricum]
MLFTTVVRGPQKKRGPAQREATVRCAERGRHLRRSIGGIAGPLPTIEESELRWIPGIGEPPGRCARMRVISDDSPPSSGTP